MPGSEGGPPQQCGGPTRRFRIQRRTKPGSTKRCVYTWPSKKSLNSITAKVRNWTRRNRHRSLAHLLRAVNPVLRGWCNYFKHGVSKRTFGYLDYYAFWRVVRWLRKRHYGLNWGTIRRRFLQDWEITDGSARMFRPRSLPVTRYRYRGTKIPTPWTSWREEPTTTPA